jgi:hypothetical protein
VLVSSQRDYVRTEKYASLLLNSVNTCELKRPAYVSCSAENKRHMPLYRCIAPGPSSDSTDYTIVCLAFQIYE